MSLQSTAVNALNNWHIKQSGIHASRYDDAVSIGVAEEISPDTAMIAIGLLNAAAMPSIAR